MKETMIVGVDIGGTHISACIVDINSYKTDEQSFVRMKVNPEGTKEETIEVWSQCIQTCLDQYPSLENKRIGIAMPGPFDYEKGISQITGLCKFECLYGLSVKDMLAEKLSIPVGNIRMVNDASAYLLGEMMVGAGKLYSKAAGITLGTGVGSATYSDSNIYEGDLWSTAFKSSRAEDYLCSKWFTSEYTRLSGRSIQDVKSLIALYDTDPSVKEVLSAFSAHLAEVLLMKYPPHTQDVIIIGGNIAKAWNYFVPETILSFEKKGVVMNLQPAVLGENAAIAGAAYLWRQ